MYTWDPFSAWGPEGPKRFDPEVLLKLAVAVLLGFALLHYGARYPVLFSVVFVIIAVLAVAVVIHVLATVLRVQYASRWGPPRTVPATVARKWTEEHDVAFPTTADPVQHAVQTALDMDSTATLYEDWGFWVAFEIEGRQEEFRVPEALYVGLEEGQEGILTYRGERLIRFVPLDKQGVPPDDSPGGPGWCSGPRLPRTR